MNERRRSPIDQLWTVVLAAGGSSRLGEPKQLVRVRGRALLLRALDAASAATPGRVLVVLGAHALRLRGVLLRRRKNVRLVYNSRWPEGLATSIRAGVAALPADARSVLFLVCDQPRVTAASIERLVRAWASRPGVPAAASYLGRVGVPAILPRRALRSLGDLSGDTGARALLRSAAAEVTEVEMPEAGLDVDTREDLAGL